METLYWLGSAPRLSGAGLGRAVRSTELIRFGLRYQIAEDANVTAQMVISDIW